MSFPDTPKSPCFESTLEKVVYSTDMIKTAYDEIRELMNELSNLKDSLQKHVSKLFLEFGRVEEEVTSRSHISCISTAIANCGSLCKEIEEIMDQIKHLCTQAETMHSECLKCFDYIKDANAMKDSIHEWMIVINRSVSRIQRDTHHSKDILNFTPMNH